MSKKNKRIARELREREKEEKAYVDKLKGRKKSIKNLMGLTNLYQKGKDK